MSTNPEEGQVKEQKRQERQQLRDTIGRHVINALGQPGDPHRVHVRQLWENRYRVNILLGVDAASARIAHSYFLVTDGHGNIVESAPEITRQY
jgi:hypothetical protein